MSAERLVPALPPEGQSLRLVLDTDFGNEIDDLFALALALVWPERIRLEGIVGANFNNGSPGAGPGSPKASCDLIHRFLAAAGLNGKYPVKEGSHPMQYYGHPSESEGVDFIIERAHSGSADDPLWVVGLGAATDLASAILKDPSIVDKVRYVFHSRSEYSWPERSMQFNVKGDIHAARTLLKKQVPLVWFDTGTYLVCPVETMDRELAHTGGMGKFLCDYRRTQGWFMPADKGFYDMGDIAWLIAPEICEQHIVEAPTMDEYMFFDQKNTNGKMLRVFDIENEATWNLLYEGIRKNYRAIGGI